MSAASAWKPVIPVGELRRRGLAETAVGPCIVVLAWVDGAPWAASGLCPHESTRLAGGRIAGGRLHCPRHRASLCLRTGAPDDRWQIEGLTLDPVRVSGDLVELDVSVLQDRRN